MMEISLDGVKKYLDTTLILKNISFMVTEGEKVGIVGENGSGKTTILKLIAGILTLNHCAGYPYAPVPPGFDEGWVNTPKGAVCAYLDQIPQYPYGTRVIDVLKSAFEEVYRLECDIHELEEDLQYLEGADLDKALKRYGELIQAFEVMEGYHVEEKLNRICKGLHFDEKFLIQDFNLLSGGEKTTVTLGKLLIDMPDILLLDEPTNHLDMESVEWLEEYLRSYKGIVIVVSHDRYFLDHVVTKIIEIDDKVSSTYIGNYSDYIIQREEKLRIQLENYKEQNKKIDAMEQSIKQLRDWATKADNNKFFKRAASMQIKLDKLERIDQPTMKQNMKLSIQQSEQSGKITIKAGDLSKSFGQKSLFRHAEMAVHYGERVAMIGPNGCGKTTFLKMLLGEETTDSGAIQLGANVLLAYLPQTVSFPNEELTVLDYFREDLFILEGKGREYLAKYMFYGSNVFKKIKLLSGGERLRLNLSKLLFNDINLLILDEPTNHLDTKSIESVEEALAAFKGTIFFISHDRYFINKISDRVVAIEEGTIQSYLGNYDYYKSIKEKQGQQAEVVLPAKAEHQAEKHQHEKHHSEKYQVEKHQPKKHKSDRQKEAPKITAGKEADAAKIENSIRNIENQIKEIEAVMETVGANYEELNALYEQKEKLGKELEEAMEMWLSLSID